MKSAHVGYIKSEQDYTMRAIAVSWLVNHQLSHLIGKRKDQDVIDLRKGRDFLAEEKMYDLVILYNLYDPPGGYQGSKDSQRAMVNRGGTIREIKSEVQYVTCSPLHDWMNWRNRLVQTSAQVIITFGGGLEVSGRYLGSLDGYNKEECPAMMTVFIKTHT